ncbi:MAG: polysaccharide biosynthesis protein GumH [Variovorax sp.]|nr:polysaccharide biosynthesis protein GumH [Variovorax sp.]
MTPLKPIDTAQPAPVRQIGPVRMQVTTSAAAVADILQALSLRQARVFAFCNMHTFNMARRSPCVAAALWGATVYNDGIGIDIASRILFGTAFPENLNGTDLTPALLGALDRPTLVYLVGGLPGVAERAAASLTARFPNVRIAGASDGYFDAHEGDCIAQCIGAAGAELVLVGMGNPRQELWASEVYERAGAVMLCIGAYLDFAAGRVRRAPAWVRGLRCEWLYRLAIEPSRMWRRYLGGASPFLLAILIERLRRSRKPPQGAV